MNFSKTSEEYPTSYSTHEHDLSGTQRSVELTPEEIRILKLCAQEGIVTRAIPMGILFGVGALVGARNGFLNHSRWGAKPAIIGFGMLGYFIGRFSYSKVCFQRALAVPDGNLRKLFPQLADPSRQIIESNENYFAAVEPQSTPDQTWKPQSYSTDIDLASTTSYDTRPSGDYYNEVASPQSEPPKNYTSYDDLRKDNRQEYIAKLYPEQKRNTPRQEAPGPTRESQFPKRPEPQERSPFDGTQKTKYGDSWG